MILLESADLAVQSPVSAQRAFSKAQLFSLIEKFSMKTFQWIWQENQFTSLLPKTLKLNDSVLQLIVLTSSLCSFV